MIDERESTGGQIDSRTLIVISCVAALLFLWKLDAVTQFTRAEVYFAEVAREMLVTGDWITPRFCGQIFFDKPPLTYWLIALTFQVFGLSEAAARIPSALAGIATVSIVSLFTIRHYGQKTGILAGLVLTTSLGFWAFARCAMSDALLTLFICGAMFSLWQGVSSTERWKTFITTGYLSLGFAFLTKGPIGPLLVFLSVGLSAIAIRQIEWKRVLYPFGILAFFVIAAPWYIAAFLKHGNAFLEYFFVGENVSRFLGEKYLKNRLPIYYLGVLLTLFFPWSVWAPVALTKAFRSSLPDTSATNNPNRFLLSWVVATVGFFSISRFKLDYYILPCYPALSILTAAGLVKLFHETDQAHRMRITLTSLTAVLFAALGIVFWKQTSSLVLSISAAVGAGFLLFSLRTAYTRAVPFLMAGIVASIFVLLPSSGQGSSDTANTIHHFAELIQASNPGGNQPTRIGAAYDLATWDADLRFYTGLAVERLENDAALQKFIRKEEPALLMLPEENLHSIASRNPKILAHGPYVGHGLWNKRLREQKQKRVLLVRID